MAIEIGELIKTAIKERNMTQKQVAEELHISPQALSNIVTNKRTPNLDCFFELIDLLGIDGHLFCPNLYDRAYINKLLDKKISTLSFEQKQLLYLFVNLLVHLDKA